MWLFKRCESCGKRKPPWPSSWSKWMRGPGYYSLGRSLTTHDLIRPERRPRGMYRPDPWYCPPCWQQLSAERERQEQYAAQELAKKRERAAWLNLVQTYEQQWGQKRYKVGEQARRVKGHIDSGAITRAVVDAGIGSCCYRESVSNWSHAVLLLPNDVRYVLLESVWLIGEDEGWAQGFYSKVAQSVVVRVDKGIVLLSNHHYSTLGSSDRPLTAPEDLETYVLDEDDLTTFVVDEAEKRYRVFDEAYSAWLDQIQGSNDPLCGLRKDRPLYRMGLSSSHSRWKAPEVLL